MEFETKEIQKALVITITGVENLAAYNSKELRENLLRLTEPNTSLVIDLSAISYLDSSGIGTLIGVKKELEKRGGDVRLTGINPGVQAIFDTIRAHRVFEMYGSVQEAAESY